MATSTPDNVRTYLQGKLQTLAAASYGFDSGAGSVQDTLLEHAEQIDVSKVAAYLKHACGGVQKLRTIGIFVGANDIPYGSKNLLLRTYFIRLRWYYDPSDVNLMTTHIVKFFELFSLGTIDFSFDGMIENLQIESPTEEPVLDQRESVGRFVYKDVVMRGTKAHPAFS